jgi:hypothetical protein
MEILGLLESAIGLVLIYLVLSLMCSAWVEAIVNWTGLRGENLPISCINFRVREPGNAAIPGSAAFLRRKFMQ